MSLFERVQRSSYNYRKEQYDTYKVIMLLLQPVDFVSIEMKQAIISELGLTGLTEGELVRYDTNIIGELNKRRAKVLREIISRGDSTYWFNGGEGQCALINNIHVSELVIDERGTIVNWYLQVKNINPTIANSENQGRPYLNLDKFAKVDFRKKANCAIVREILSKSDIPQSSYNVEQLQDPVVGVAYVKSLFMDHMDGASVTKESDGGVAPNDVGLINVVRKCLAFSV